MADLDPATVDLGGSLAASGGHWQVAQLVHGAPDGDLQVTLTVAGAHLHLAVSPAGAAAEPGDGPDGVSVASDAGQPGGTSEAGAAAANGAGDAPAGAPDVTVSLSYDDAQAMSRGELDPAEAINQGRVRVRGDLAVLVAGQSLLSAATPRLAPLQATTTY